MEASIILVDLRTLFHLFCNNFKIIFRSIYKKGIRVRYVQSCIPCTKHRVWNRLDNRIGKEGRRGLEINEKAATFKGTNCIAVLKKKLEKWSK